MGDVGMEAPEVEGGAAVAHVFISHAHEDVDFASSVILEIEKKGFTHWIDSEQLGIGDDWRQKIDDAIRSSFALIAVMTPEAKVSDYATYEWIFAFGLGIKVIPVIFKTTNLHPKMQSMNYLDFSNPRGRRWDILIEELSKAQYEYDSTTIRISYDAPPAIKRAVEALDSFRQDERFSAIERLAQIDHPEARSVLAQALSHSMRDVRIYAALRLAELTDFKDKRTIPGLLEGLKEVNSRYGEIAEESLKKIGAPAVPGLILALQDEDWRVRHRSVHALSEIKDESAVRGLIQALYDNNDHVTKNAAEALEQIATPEALAAVEQWRREQGGQQG